MHVLTLVVLPTQKITHIMDVHCLPRMYSLVTSDQIRYQIKFRSSYPTLHVSSHEVCTSSFGKVIQVLMFYGGVHFIFWNKWLVLITTLQ